MKPSRFEKGKAQAFGSPSAGFLSNAVLLMKACGPEALEFLIDCGLHW